MIVDVRFVGIGVVIAPVPALTLFLVGLFEDLRILKTIEETAQKGHSVDRLAYYKLAILSTQ